MANQIKKARVLVSCVIAGRDLRPNDVIEMKKSMIKTLVLNGQVDDSEPAVNYALEQVDGEVHEFEGAALSSELVDKSEETEKEAG